MSTEPKTWKLRLGTLKTQIDQLKHRHWSAPRQPATPVGDLTDYWRQASDWANCQYDNAILWQHRCMLITAVMVILNILLIVVLFRLMPLKENTPYLVMLQESTGQPSIIKPINTADIEQNQTLKTHMLTKFLVARESFDIKTLENDLDVVRVIGSDSLYRDYQALLYSTAPENPVKRYEGQQRQVQVSRVMHLNDNRAIVFFTATTQGRGQRIVEHLSADISFHFAQRELNQREAEVINPVNFEITAYRVQTEMAPTT